MRLPVDMEMRPQITATAVKRAASSDCHGAKLDPGADPGAFTCRECGQPCGRVLGEPQEVTFYG